MRGDWNRAGRNQPQRRDVTTEEQRALIRQCAVTLADGWKTWHNVHSGGELKGQVRTTFGGQEYRRVGQTEPCYAGSRWGPGDPKHALAILCLLSPDT
jgi:hypothetical protein